MRNSTTMISKALPSGLATCFLWFGAVSGFAQSNSETTEATQPGALWPLLTVETVLVVITLFGLPLLASWLGKEKASERRGLGLPRGSVRSMLALLIVGSTINFLLFGSIAFGENFNEIIAGLVALSGSVTGFYFGGRTAASPPDRTGATEREDGRT